MIYIKSLGRSQVSDKYLTEHSDFLRNILPGDIVLTDWF